MRQMGLDWKSHMLAGFLFGAAVAHFAFQLQPTKLLAFSLVSASASLLPDLDAKNSKISSLLRIIAFGGSVLLAIWLSYLQGLALPGFLWLLAIFLAALFAFGLFFRLRHRGITHSLFFLFLAAGASWLILGEVLAVAVAAGIFSHFLLDLCLKLA
ncbi:MAG: metal-dependent hydrolase [Candidatus Micrarchaeota archaeon]|nr:metal-dependent hydrolase [Candidatus Micrarchaeota archaeon]